MGTVTVSLPSDGTTADVNDFGTPITTIVNEINGNLDNTNLKANAAIAGSKLADNGIDLEQKASSDSGWREVTDSWAYASATTITVPTDATTKYSVGDKIRLTQTTVKYFYIVGVATTTLTITGGSDYTLVNAAISDISYSKAVNPVGFPQRFVYSPTLSGRMDDADWTKACTFEIIGKRCFYDISLTASAAAPAGGGAGEFTFSFPVTTPTYGGTATLQEVGHGKLFDATGLRYIASVYWLTTTTGVIRYMGIDTAGTPDTVVDAACSSTIPFTWTTSDEILLTGSVKIA